MDGGHFGKEVWSLAAPVLRAAGQDAPGGLELSASIDVDRDRDAAGAHELGAWLIVLSCLSMTSRAAWYASSGATPASAK